MPNIQITCERKDCPHYEKGKKNEGTGQEILNCSKNLFYISITVDRTVCFRCSLYEDHRSKIKSANDILTEDNTDENDDA